MEKITNQEISGQEAEVALMKEKLDKLYKSAFRSQAHNEFSDFAEGLKKKYPDFESYRLYHVLVGSTPKGKCEKYDFPDEDSVEVFIWGTHAKYLSENQPE